MEKLQVPLNQAVDMAAKGYEVECYVIVSNPACEPAKRKRTGTQRAKIPNDAKFMLSFDGTRPEYGKAHDALEAMIPELWGDDPAATYTAKELRDGLDHHGSSRHMFSQLVHHYGVFRRVDD